MAGLLIIITAVFAISFLATPLLGGGWYWDFGNALGFAGLAGLLFQMIPLAKARTFRRHELLGYWALAMIALHAVWFLAGEGVVRVYLQAGAPLHMWLGLIGIVVISLLLILARMPDRMRAHRHYRSFKSSHRLLGITAVVTAILHILLSGFYISVWWQIVLLSLLAAACCFMWHHLTVLPKPLPTSGLVFVLATVLTMIGFVAIRNLAS